MIKLIVLVFLPFYFLFAKNENVYIKEEFRIYYTLTGKNALPLKNQEDKNNNQVPDYVESIYEKLRFASDLINKKLHFKSPLTQKRFHGAKYIDIYLINLKARGAASDILNKKNKSISIKLSTDLIPNTLTPLHEFFHLVHYGYTYFNNRWVMEGHARWIEKIAKNEKGNYKRKLPQSIVELEILLNSTYSSKYFWNRLAYLYDNSFENTQLFFLKVLEKLALYDNKAEEFYFYPKQRWTEKQQKSFNNNIFILNAIKETILALRMNEKEALDFVTLIDKYLNYMEYENNKKNLTKELRRIDFIKFSKSYDEDFIFKINKIIKEKQIKESKIFPSKSLYYNKKKTITKAVMYKNGYLYIGEYIKENSFGVYFTNKNISTFEELSLNDNYIPIDFFIENDYIYLMVKDKTSSYERIKVLRTKNKFYWDLVFQFDNNEKNLNKFFYEKSTFYFINNADKLLYTIKKEI
ncbi:hypothetical protein CRV05_06425 [Halarcobacter bivalviorum]|uniref:Peptidase MA superfamily protein n=1 Tax=Halarcobacter bivalviorum TaxID=663364 RepID=A0AAX2ABF5_9BACT|nr:hypothetical protein [Halarcobacter bivalviorum]RXK10011.1 hypothetical protein CRV05_06425 [Halarcobacter bivalviorum]